MSIFQATKPDILRRNLPLLWAVLKQPTLFGLPLTLSDESNFLRIRAPSRAQNSYEAFSRLRSVAFLRLFRTRGRPGAVCADWSSVWPSLGRKREGSCKDAHKVGCSDHRKGECSGQRYLDRRGAYPAGT